MSNLETPNTIPTRWKVFRFANYFQAILTLPFVLLIIYVLFYDYGDVLLKLLFLIAMAGIIINNFFNIHLVNRHYPETNFSVGKGNKITALLIFYFLVTVAFLILAIVGLVSELNTSRGRFDFYDLLPLTLLLAKSLIGLYILIEQVTLSGLIERNHKLAMQKLTEEIGTL